MAIELFSNRIIQFKGWLNDFGKSERNCRKEERMGHS